MPLLEVLGIVVGLSSGFGEERFAVIERQQERGTLTVPRWNMAYFLLC